MQHKNFRPMRPSLLFTICFCFSVGMIFILSLISAMIVISLDDPTAKLGIFSLVTMLLSAAVGGFFSSKIRGGMSLGYSALVSLSVVLVMLLMNVIMSGGQVSLGAFMNYGCYMGTYMLCALIIKNTANGRRRRR